MPKLAYRQLSKLDWLLFSRHLPRRFASRRGRGFATTAPASEAAMCDRRCSLPSGCRLVARRCLLRANDLPIRGLRLQADSDIEHQWTKIDGFQLGLIMIAVIARIGQDALSRLEHQVRADYDSILRAIEKGQDGFGH